MDNPWATDDHHWPEHADALNVWTTSYNGEPDPEESRPASPGGFGTFESADSTETGWSAGWAPPVDEWELAKRQKQVQDQHAPPELLASILDQFRVLLTDLWPEPGSDDGETRQPCNDFLTEVPSLKPAVDKYVPDDLILSANVQFSRTFTSKHMNEALRLTRHLPMTLSSPMSVYMASKGLTSWEAFVKSRPNICQDDVLLPGWRMIEKTERESTPTPEVKKKSGGGLLSFLGLKGTEASGTEPQKPSPSSSRPASIIGSIKSSRSSLDGSSKPSLERQSSTSQTSALSTTIISPSNPSQPGLVASPHTEQQSTQDAVQQAAPSAMGRFFGRFSRSSAISSNQTVHSRSHSLALSSNDIEFLTDIVPSANDDVDEDENLKSLINMISAKTPSSLSATPLPQPLPPPPRSTHPNTSSVTLASDSFSLLDSVVAGQPPTNTTMRPLIPTAPSTNEPASQPTPKLTTTTPVTVSRPWTHLPVRVPSPQRHSFTAVMTYSGRSTPSSLQVPLPAPPLPPPRPSSPFRAIIPPQNGPVPQPASLFADDDFSDFLSSPAMPNPPSRPSTTRGVSSSIIGASRIDASSSTQSFSSRFSDQSLLQSSSFDFRLDGFANSGKSNLQLLDDDFDEFVSSPTAPALRTPPPRPPPKMALPIMAPAPQGLNLMRNKDRESLPPPPPPLKPSREANHSRTSSLLESAAARPGRWPAPPSPLPQVIAPPPPPPPGGPSSSKKHQLGMFDGAGDETLTGGKAQLQTISKTLWNDSSRSGLAAPVMAPPPLRALNPPPKANGFTTGTRTAPWSLSANGSKPLAQTKPVTGSSNKTVGGLSAQDLSFFEGL